jgi:alkanesulfonate monooxygenase SsuD/methylene tetrahydromethanopterin reductase-like flavin-dependent oxidoreductase (luciferase family)
LQRLGFTQDDVRRPGSDKLIDAVVAHGSPEAVARRLEEHCAAGADHVAIQVLGTANEAALGELAGPLGLTPPN